MPPRSRYITNVSVSRPWIYYIVHHWRCFEYKIRRREIIPESSFHTTALYMYCRIFQNLPFDTYYGLFWYAYIRTSGLHYAFVVLCFLPTLESILRWLFVTPNSWYQAKYSSALDIINLMPIFHWQNRTTGESRSSSLHVINTRDLWHNKTESRSSASTSVADLEALKSPQEPHSTPSWNSQFSSERSLEPFKYITMADAGGWSTIESDEVRTFPPVCLRSS